MENTGDDISLIKDDAKRLALFYGAPDIEPSDGFLSEMVEHYALALEYWISIFLKGKKQNTGKNTRVIIRFLIEFNMPERQARPYNRYEWPFSWVRLKDMNNGLISQGVGRPPKRTDTTLKKGKNIKKKPKPIEHRQTMQTILEGLTDMGILQKKEQIDHYERSAPDKRKTNSYYRISPEFWRRPIVRAKGMTKPEMKRLEAKSAELHEEALTISDGKEMASRILEMSQYDAQITAAFNANVSREVLLSRLKIAVDAVFRYDSELKKCNWERSQLSQDLVIAKELMKKNGILDPDCKIKAQRKQVQREMVLAMDKAQEKNSPHGETQKTGWSEDELDNWPYRT